jgi:hypothetical protein
VIKDTIYFEQKEKKVKYLLEFGSGFERDSGLFGKYTCGVLQEFIGSTLENFGCALEILDASFFIA